MKTVAVFVLAAALAAIVDGHAYVSNPLPRAQTIPGHRHAAGVRYTMSLFLCFMGHLILFHTYFASGMH
jgi:hypothetical protein